MCRRRRRIMQGAMSRERHAVRRWHPGQGSRLSKRRSRRLGEFIKRRRRHVLDFKTHFRGAKGDNVSRMSVGGATGDTLRRHVLDFKTHFRGAKGDNVSEEDPSAGRGGDTLFEGSSFRGAWGVSIGSLAGDTLHPPWPPLARGGKGEGVLQRGESGARGARNGGKVGDGRPGFIAGKWGEGRRCARGKGEGRLCAPRGESGARRLQRGESGRGALATRGKGPGAPFVTRGKWARAFAREGRWADGFRSEGTDVAGVCLLAADPILHGFFGGGSGGPGGGLPGWVVTGWGCHLLHPFLNDLRRLAEGGAAPGSCRFREAARRKRCSNRAGRRGSACGDAPDVFGGLLVESGRGIKSKNFAKLRRGFRPACGARVAGFFSSRSDS